MYDPYTDFTKHVLSNGLEVYFMSWDRPMIGVEIVIHSGGREDPVVMPGLAHFVEHMVSCNIPYRELDQVKGFFETCGGKAGFGSTNYLSTLYKFSVPADPATFLEALTIFGSMLFGARLKKDVEKERRIILREFNGRYPFLEKLYWDMDIRKALFKGHRLETWNRPLGRPEGFLSITEADLQSFYDRHYVPANTSLVIIGGLSTKQVLVKLEESPLGMQKNGTRNQIPRLFGPLPIPAKKARIVKFSDHVNFSVDQTEYKATWAFPASFHKQSLVVFRQVLGQVLFNEIREKRNLAYNISPDYTDFQDVYEYEINGRISPETSSRINELVQECISMVPSRRDLFDRKLQAFRQKCLMVDLSGSDLIGTAAKDLVFDHRITTIQEVLDEIQKVTFEKMAEAAALLNPEQQYTFIACP